MSEFLRRSLIIFTIKGFQTIVFIFIVIYTKFRLICPPNLFRCLPNSETYTELRTTFFIESTGIACSDSVNHNRVQVLRIPLLFGMGSDINQQEEGLAIGSLLSPVLAYIYMEYFEKMSLGFTSLKPSMWLRYVDDTFTLWPHQEDDQTTWSRELNPSIQVTMEKE